MGQKTYIMGIVNVTPDSFSDGGDFFDPDKAYEAIMQMIDDGADIIDIGAQSTGPGHKEISDAEEWERLEKVLEKIKGKVSVPISIDTYFPFVAQKALENGAHIINDVSGVFNPEMAQIVKTFNAGWVVMHTGGGTADIVADTPDIIKSVNDFFDEMTEKCLSFGISKEQICLDMGIGFGKTYEQNIELIANIAKITRDDMPLLTGLSRKRVVGTATNTLDPKERLYGNIAAHCAVIAGGTDIIRVHSVKEEKQGAMMADAIYRKVK